MNNTAIIVICNLALLALGTWFFAGHRTSEHSIKMDTSATAGKVPALVQQVVDEYQQHMDDAEEQANTETFKKRYQERLIDRFDFVSFDGKVIWVDSAHFKYLFTPYIEQREEWLESLGFFFREQLDSYQGYNIEALEALGEQGDLLAWHALEAIYVEEFNVEKAIATLDKAAIYGSAYAIAGKGSFIKHDLYPYFNGDSELNRDSLISWLAHSEVAHRLGEPYTRLDTMNSLEYNNLHVSESDWQAVNHAADSLLAELEQSRQALGLGEFNTELPEHVIGYNQNMEDLAEFRKAIELLRAQDNRD